MGLWGGGQGRLRGVGGRSALTVGATEKVQGVVEASRGISVRLSKHSTRITRGVVDVVKQLHDDTAVGARHNKSISRGWGVGVGEESIQGF